jgi:uncharacterized protein YbbC (DUF1343 family)
LYAATTGLVGELGFVNIGIGFTLPFKVVGAPWIDGELFAAKLNAQHLQGVHFQPFYYRPFWGRFQGKDCQGILIRITDRTSYRPLDVQYLLLGMLKSLYPTEFGRAVAKKEKEMRLFCQASGTAKVLELLIEEAYPAWKLISFQKAEREAFLVLRKQYLLYN